MGNSNSAKNKLVADAIICNFDDYWKFYSPENLPILRFKGVIYAPVETLGAGGFGSVTQYSASESGPHVAIKSELPRDGYYREGKYYAKEANINALVYGVGEISGNPRNINHAHHLLMHFIEGITLFDLCTQLEQSAFELDSPCFLLKIWLLAACAIANLHGATLVHTDLNPYNIIVSPDYSHCDVIDFGQTVSYGNQRDDLRNYPEKQEDYPWYPPEAFHDSGKGTIAADYAQDSFAMGYHLHYFKEWCVKKIISSEQDPG